MNRCYFEKTMDFFYNNSHNQNQECTAAPDWSGTPLIIVLCFGSFFCLFIFLSNVMVIAAVIINKRFHFPFYYLLANLAAADFFAGIAYVYLMFNTGPVSATLTVHWWFVRQGLLDTSLSASLANLLVIALERYISVMRMKVHSNLTKRRVIFLIVLVWAVSILMGAVPSLGWNCICSLDVCSVLAPVYSRSYLIFWSVSNLVVFLIMLVIYLRIYLYVKKKTIVLSSHTNGSISRRRTPIKLMKTVMTVLGAFVICWTPGLVLLLLDGLHCTHCKLCSVKRWFLLLALLNSAMNPIIYSYKDEEMWNTFKNILRYIFCRKNNEMVSRSNLRALSSSIDNGSRYTDESQASFREGLKA
ncbi:lysophosphatidic acid receptor 3 [Erpetoichthys calabaricus]|uniref:lysophosphatidic acid receptor 3 n=1 Tax=Erpetoichthys calabaricus TaxID=27687 RepID=UPI00109FEDD7|nr:lysophosphatidic acid receptor 3 [Erpetoichthys calabaricus]